MNHQGIHHINGTTSNKHNQGPNKKKRKRKFFQINDNSPNLVVNTSPTIDKSDDISKSLQPSKKRRKNKKKKVTKEGSTEALKPILIVKNPEDYSANWKMLKEIITKDDKKTNPGNFIRRVNKNTQHNKSKVKQQKTNGIESTDDKVENQEETTEQKEELDIWFDNVDPILLEENTPKKDKKPDIKPNIKKVSSTTLVKEDSFEGATKVVAMDCEMVGVGMNGKDSILARVSIVNHYGKTLYDEFVKPTEEVVDYRTAVSGIRPADIVNGCDFKSVQKEVSDLIAGRILVGHAIYNDLRILYLSHPRSDIRDTSRYKGFKRVFGGRTPSLKKLVERFLGVQIQQGEHNSVQDAQAAMRLYTMHRREWEKSRPNKYKKRQIAKTEAAATKNKEQSSEAPRGD